MRMVRLVSMLVVAACGASSVYAQSLGEIARKEEERRKAIKASGKVYTEADLKRFGGVQPASEPVAVPAAAPTAAEGATPARPAEGGAAAVEGGQPGAGATAAAEPERDEAWWRQQFAEARQKLASSRPTYQALRLQYDLLGAVLTDDPAERARIDREREHMKAEIDRLGQQVDSLARALATLEEEARRANVPPGWIR